MQKPQVTEIQVRMDCNGCVHKIKKALSGINGIYDLHIDLPQQKITVIGWADQEKIVKAIKKTRKTATICYLTEQVKLESPYQPAEPGPAPGGSSPAPDQTQQPPAETPPDETRPQAEPPGDTPPPPPGETIPTDNNSQKSENIPGTKYLEEVHEIHQYSPYYANRFDSGRCHSSTSYSQGLSSSMYMPHGYYDTDKSSPYVTEYEYVISPLRHYYHSRVEYYGGDNQSGNANITSILSDEDPNACRII
ncbi:hypothetical protein QN277_000354 [Acacia crassicarpa]|uniref:HMA domain-containing protein n=1 Tax=Acacia crassicarpa TaxID=499986 RepID=A0AAE1N653_9FABA|nr:hypothetical protein QN277_000354 [Acacia crassicarpa]